MNSLQNTQRYYHVKIRSVWIYGTTIQAESKEKAEKIALKTEIDNFDEIEENIEWKIDSIKEVLKPEDANKKEHRPQKSRVKIFYSDRLDALEEKSNHWLKKNVQYRAVKSIFGLYGTATQYWVLALILE